MTKIEREAKPGEACESCGCAALFMYKGVLFCQGCADNPNCYLLSPARDDYESKSEKKYVPYGDSWEKSAFLSMLILIEETTRKKLLQLHESDILEYFPYDDIESDCIAILLAASKLCIYEFRVDSLILAQKERCAGRFPNFQKRIDLHEKNLISELDKLGIQYAKA